MILLVAGGRTWGRAPEAAHERALLLYCLSVLDDHGPAFDPTCPEGSPSIGTVISGGTLGADAFGANWGRYFGRVVETFLPDWATFGRRAGPKRNQAMLERLVQLRDEGHVVAGLLMPGSTGTADMRRRLDAAGVTVYGIDSFEACLCHARPTR
jgi:hypothetical protein